MFQGPRKSDQSLDREYKTVARRGLIPTPWLERCPPDFVFNVLRSRIAQQRLCDALYFNGMTMNPRCNGWAKHASRRAAGFWRCKMIAPDGALAERVEPP
jgi:hypothetical protein